MSIVYSSVLDHPIGEVFGWHERPGAFQRLTPPWLGARLLTEAPSLADGRAVIRLPGGVRWVARHHDYDPPYRFVDDLVSLPLPWRHVHTFAPEGPSRTRLTDRVSTPVPASALRRMFAYRHAQLRDDLAVQAELRRIDPAARCVALTGSSGLVGTALSAFLSTAGHRVIRLVRRAPRADDERTWDPADPDPAVFEGVDAVVHLAGASIAGRFTSRHKEAIASSRIEPTRRLADALARANGPRVLLAASAIGYYGSDRGDELLDEGASRGDGFLADVVARWEAAAVSAGGGGVRVVVVRTGIVLSSSGGMLALLRPLFLAGLGGRVCDGDQWLSWIDLDDLTDVYARALVDPAMAGVLNAVAPNPVRNAELTRVLAGVLHRPAPIAVPKPAVAVVLGSEGAQELACASQRVAPARLEAAGFHFRRPVLDACLRHQLGRSSPPPQAAS
jgi:uncharacterized protein (TIGR01777 family)